MASLTQISIISRKVIRYGIYAIILIVIARYVFKGATSLYTYLFPPKQDPPTVAFGKLSKIPFPEKSFPDNLSFVLETPDGKLPLLPEQNKAYFMPHTSSSIQSVDVARNKARRLGFDPNGKPIVETIPNVYIFNKPKAPSTLTMNIITGIFSINYDVNSNPSVLENLPLAHAAAIAHARSYLSSAGYLSKDLKTSPATATLLRLEGGEFVPAISLSEATLIKVNIFRKLMGKDDDVPSVTPDMPESNVWFLLSGRGGREVIAAEYHYFPVDENRSATYPLITADEAWEQLESGNAYIANLGNNNSGKITIRKIYLAYYDPGQYTEHYQLVVAFEGDNEFYAFVPAITSDYYGK